MEQEQREQTDLDKQIKALMADMVKLNSLLSKNSDLNQALQQSNSLMETEFRQRLKVQLYTLCSLMWKFRPFPYTLIFSVFVCSYSLNFVICTVIFPCTHM